MINTEVACNTRTVIVHYILENASTIFYEAI